MDRAGLAARALLFALFLAAWAWGRSLFLAVNGARSPVLDLVGLPASELGNAALVGLLLALLAPFRRREALTALLGVALAGAAVTLLKAAIPSPRPFAVLGGSVHVLGLPLSSGSFPSGHTATAFAAAAALRGGLPAAAWWGVAVSACAVGWGRVYIGAHWPLDAAAGALLGWMAGDLARGPLAPAAAWAAKKGAALDRGLLLLGLGAALFLGFFERLIPFAPVFFRGVGVAGLAACTFLLARSFRPGGAR